MLIFKKGIWGKNCLLDIFKINLRFMNKVSEKIKLICDIF